ncbi:MAG: hypothetical protein QOK17_794 [Sphingomonadales bacterium]|jgi:YD repeat-containing protein|nr:hypothetical protein [Sphingomonadales bacterium]
MLGNGEPQPRCDALGRLVSSATNMDGTTRTLTSTYDAASGRTALTGDSGAWGYTAGFARDTLGRLTGTIESGYSTSTLAYDQAGRRSSLGLGFNGTSSSDSYGYDAVGRLTSLGHDLTGTTYDQSLGFSYNPASQIKQNTRSNDTGIGGGYLLLSSASQSGYAALVLGLGTMAAVSGAWLTRPASVED